MNILDALKRLRDDIKTWVTNNLNALNAKIDEKTIPIDSELNSTSTNPVQNKAITNAINNIPRFSGSYNDLTDAPDISEDDSGNMIIADESGNIIFKADADGIHTTAVSLNGEAAASEKYVDEAIANIDIPEVDFTGYATETYVDNKVADLVNSAPEALNTLGELAAALENHEDAYDALLETVGGKATHADLENLKEELSESITAEAEDWKVVDSDGNIIFSVDASGAHTTNLTLNGEEAATESYVNESLATKQPIGDYALKSEIPEVSPAIIDVIELPTENIKEDVYYRKLIGSPVRNQVVRSEYTCHCVESLPPAGLPAMNLELTGGHVYYNVGDGELYGYVDDILSIGLNVPSGWYPAATLLGALGYSYSGTITDIMDDPIDDSFRLLLIYTIYSYKEGVWTAQKTIGWMGNGTFAEIFNHPSNSASGFASHAEGESSHAEGDCSHAEGYDSYAEGKRSHAEGSHSHAEGFASHAEGESSHAEGRFSHAEGYYSYAEGESSHAEGESSRAEGYASHAEGYDSYAEGSHSHAEGCYSYAEGESSHAEGKNSCAEGDYSHAEGCGETLYRQISGDANATVYTIDSINGIRIGSLVRYTPTGDDHIDGCIAKIIFIDKVNSTITLNRTISEDVALNNVYVYIYLSTMTLGTAAHVEGWGNIATGKAQHVQGEYNIVDPEYDVNNNDKRAKYAHIVGNGSDEDNRSNAHTLDWSGNGWFAGEVYVGGTGQNDSAAVKLAKMSDIPSTEGLATESYVNSAVASLVNSAPEVLNTLDELAAALGDDPNFATTVVTELGKKANTEDLGALATKDSLTASEVGALSKDTPLFSGDYNDLENAPDISEDDSGDLIIADKDGNIIFRSNGNGFETVNLTVQNITINGKTIQEMIQDYVNEAILGGAW